MSMADSASDQSVTPRPVYRVIADEDRRFGNPAPLDRAIEAIRRQYDQFCAMYPRGRGAEFIVCSEIRRPGS